jgi:hypothetical protein
LQEQDADRDTAATATGIVADRRRQTAETLAIQEAPQRAVNENINAALRPHRTQEMVGGIRPKLDVPPATATYELRRAMFR